MILSF